MGRFQEIHAQRDKIYKEMYQLCNEYIEAYEDAKIRGTGPSVRLTEAVTALANYFGEQPRMKVFYKEFTIKGPPGSN